MMIYNMVFNDCFYKANSTIPDLHIIILRLHEVEMRGELIVHVINVAEIQIKELVIFSLSKGDSLEVVMARKDPL